MSVLPDAGVDRIYGLIQEIEKLKDLQAVTSIIAGDIDQLTHQAAA